MRKVLSLIAAIAIIVTLFATNIFSVSAQTDEATIADFCNGETSFTGSYLDIAGLEIEEPCPRHWRSGEPYWLDGAMYSLQFSYEGSFQQMIFTEWSILLEQLVAANENGATVFVLSVLPQQNCETFTAGETVYNNALNGLYARPQDLSVPTPRVSFFFHEELTILGECQETNRDNSPIWYVKVESERGITGWVGTHWIHASAEFYVPTDSDTDAFLAPEYSPITAPWETEQTTIEATAEVTEVAETCEPLLTEANFTIGTSVQVNSSAGLIRLRDAQNPTVDPTDLPNGTEIVIIGQPTCASIFLSGNGWSGDFYFWWYPVVTLTGQQGLVAAQAADASQVYLAGN